MNEVFQRALSYINSKMMEYADDPERGLRLLINSHRMVAIEAIKEPAVPQLQALKIYPGLDHLNLLQLRRGLEAGTLRLEAVPEDIAIQWREELDEAGFKSTLIPLDQNELEARLREAGLAP